MLPAKRGEVFKVLVGNIPSLLPEMFNRFFDVNRIPNGYGRDDEVECTGTIVLILKTSVVNAPQSMNR